MKNVKRKPAVQGCKAGIDVKEPFQSAKTGTYPTISQSSPASLIATFPEKAVMNVNRFHLRFCHRDRQQVERRGQVFWTGDRPGHQDS